MEIMRRYALLSMLMLSAIIAGLSVSTVSFAADRMLYKVAFEGVGDDAIVGVLNQVSRTVSLRDRPPSSPLLLRRRAENDIPRLHEALRAFGYYGGVVTSSIDTKSEPIVVTFSVDLGPVYLVNVVDIMVADKVERTLPPMPAVDVLGLAPGDPARSKRVVEAEGSLVRWFQRYGYPFVKVAEREVIVNHASRSMSVTYHVRLGPWARFGPTTIVGLATVDEDYVRSKIPWNMGDEFNGALLKELQGNVMATGLFVTVYARPDEALDSQGQLPVTIGVTERKHRTVKGGVSWKTDEGLGGKVSWEHRNLLGKGEGLRVALEGSEILAAGEGDFRKPEFLRTDQTFRFNVRLAEDDPDAFTSLNITGAAVLERRLSTTMSASAGLALRFAQVDQLNQDESFALFYIPGQMKWDTSDSALDPTRGGRLALQAAPYAEMSEKELSFVKGYASMSRYVTLLSSPRLVAAGKMSCGAMSGASLEAIPADLRFYAGGGGSIRGYAYQSVGPLVGGEPIGGRSVVEVSGELRLDVSKRIGVVGFLDGGNVYRTTVPNVEDELQWGGGIGFRYFTPVGPLRFDVGFPLNPRDEIDDEFQIYVSLGQAF